MQFGIEPPNQPNPAEATLTTLSGRLFAPDGVTPISNALVYVEGSTRAPSSMATQAATAAVACGTLPVSTWAYVCTGVDGSYVLRASITSPSARLVAVKGAFSVTTSFMPQAGQTIMMPPISIVTTGPTAARMAVVTGDFDSVQDILAKLGFGTADSSGRLQLGTERFDLFDGNDSLGASYRDLEALLDDADGDGRADIYNYAIVFFNCGLRSLESNPGDIETLRNYVASGGRIYVSDLSYDLVEQAFPAYIDFQGSDAIAASQPEVVDAAELGSAEITVLADVAPSLGAWLRSVGCVTGSSCLDANGRAPIEGFLDGWAVMIGPHQAPPSPVTVWVQGPVVFSGQSTPVNRPLTVSFNHGSGRVTYTSYHNEPEFNVPGGFVAAERILQFLVFEL